MSAGICIMNRNAIAMAADSAVTVGDHIAIHNSANKLFSLSRVAPVGLIIYANAALMNLPVEIIVKEYKRQLRDRTFPHLKDYVDDFIQYMEQNTALFRFDINEQNYIIQIFSNLMSGMLHNYNEILNSASTSSSSPLSSDELAKIGEAAFQATINFVGSVPKRADYHFGDYVKSKYCALFTELLKKDTNLSWLTDEQRNKLSEKACEIFDTDFETNGFVGVAIAGFGEQEIYPHMVHLHISGLINGKLRFLIHENVEITESSNASIVPLAQTDVMQTFLFGINVRFLEDLSREIPKQIGESINSMDESFFAEGKKHLVTEQLNNITGNILKHMIEAARSNYMLPIIQSVASLPIEELALLAESMINITSLRRKVALDRNIGTVGGPIDVSIISKGDGFIWLKRKHYFDRKYNPQYFYSHFRPLEKDGIDESEE